MKTLIACLLLLPTIAYADCGTHAQAMAMAEHFGEIVKHSEFGYKDNKFVGWWQWTENKKTQTWTLLLTLNGQTCIVATSKQIKGPES